MSYKTAWYLGHRVRSAMEEDSPVPLEGIVEADETWIGGLHHKTRQEPWALSQEAIVLGAIARDGEVRLVMAPWGSRESKASYRRFIKMLSATRPSTIFTDSDSSWGEMTSWKPDGTKHRKVDHGDNEWVRGIVHTNTIEGVWSLFKRSVVGTYHQLSAQALAGLSGRDGLPLQQPR